MPFYTNSRRERAGFAKCKSKRLFILNDLPLKSQAFLTLFIKFSPLFAIFSGEILYIVCGKIFATMITPYGRTLPQGVIFFV